MTDKCYYKLPSQFINKAVGIVFKIIEMQFNIWAKIYIELAQMIVK